MKRTVMIGLGAWAVSAAVVGCTPPTEEYVNQGIDQIKAGNLAGATVTFQQVRDRNPSDPLGLYYMGRIHQARREYDRAIYFYQCCLDVDPSFGQAAARLAEIRRETEEVGSVPAEAPASPQPAALPPAPPAPPVRGASH